MMASSRTIWWKTYRQNCGTAKSLVVVQIGRAVWLMGESVSEQTEASPLLDTAVPKFERIMIDAALRKTGGRKKDAAELLGWGRNT